MPLKTARSLISKLRLFRQCLLLGFLLSPVMAVGQSLAEQEDKNAQGILSFIYQNGEGQSLAEQGDANAQYGLGVIYARGDGVPQDFAEAAKWFRLAAEQGDKDA
jgi:TPR repeat protein